MTEQEKQLLLKDLCARLPYHPIVHVEHDIGGFIETADLQVYGYEDKLKLLREDNETFCYLPIKECKPYLRPMSSMIEEEKEEYHNLCYEEEEEWYEFGEWTTKLYFHDTIESFDWLNAHHFDYRGLIDKDLAIEAPEGMYKEK